MVYGVGASCSKYLLCCFNFLFCICGGAILSLSLWVRFDSNFARYLETLVARYAEKDVDLSQYYIGLYALAAVGALLFFAGFLGCCGAMCESVPLILLFFVIMLLLFVAELCAAVYVLVRKDDFRAELSHAIRDKILPEYHNNPEVRDQIDGFQTQFGCCGAEGCGDYPGIPPESCGCGGGLFGNTPGCVDMIFAEINNNMTIVAAIAIGILTVEIVGMVLALVLCCSVRRGPDAYI